MDCQDCRLVDVRTNIVLGEGLPLKVLLFPEYTKYTVENYKQIAKDLKIVVIGGIVNNKVEVVLTDGDIVKRRAKVHLTPSEQENNMLPGNSIFPFEYNNVRVLSLICFEICFPEDYYHLKNIQLITHHVGFPMYDKYQFQGWLALQKAAAHHFNCTVLCSCGGKPGPLNLTGTVLP